MLLLRAKIERMWARLIGLQGRMYKFGWSRNQEGYGGVGVLVKEELCLMSLKLEE